MISAFMFIAFTIVYLNDLPEKWLLFVIWTEYMVTRVHKKYLNIDYIVNSNKSTEYRRTGVSGKDY